MHELARWLGLTNASGAWYLWWSGIAGDLGLLGGGALVYRRFVCHTNGCWRLGHYPVSNTPYKVCSRHHPKVPNRGASHEHILAAHRDANAR